MVSKVRLSFFETVANKYYDAYGHMFIIITENSSYIMTIMEVGAPMSYTYKFLTNLHLLFHAAWTFI